jgi:DNA-binding beta-propeller fold protein YncE
MVLFSDQLFVARLPASYITTNEVEVYNSSSLQLLRYISISGYNGKPSGLAVDPATNSLYVNDNSHNVLYKVNLATLTSTTLSVNTANSMSLSVNSAHNILVSYATLSKIEEYTPSGTLVRTISPGNNVWHAVEVSNGTLAVSRIGAARYDVSLMSYTGQVVSSYGSTTAGTGPGQINNPRSMAIDKQGYVLVAVISSNGVLALDSTLSSACNVILPVNPTSPRTLWLDESRNRLYVGEGGGQNRVLVFDNFSKISDAF